MKKFKYLYIVLFLVLLVVLSVGYFFINREVQEERLASDVLEFSKQNLLDDVSFSDSNVTGDYLVVEESIQSYLSQFRKQFEIVNSYSQDEKLKSLLSVSNYMEDGPSFSTSIDYLSEQKEKFNQDMDTLLSFCEKSSIQEFIQGSDLSSYYQNLFEDMMFNYGIYDKLQNVKESLVQSKDNLNQIYDGSLEVLSFLSTYQNDWKIENNEIQFSTEDLVNQYTSLTSLVQS